MDWQYVTFHMTGWEEHATLPWYSQQNTSINHKEVSYRPKLREILQNNWCEILKNIEVMKEKIEESFQIERDYRDIKSKWDALS